VRVRTNVVAGSRLALATAFLAGIAAAPQDVPARGARVAVVAFHDSHLLTLCPVFGKQAVVSNVWTPKMAAKVTVFYSPTGQQFIGLHAEPDNSRRVMLPMPAGQAPAGFPAGPPPAAFVALDRLARDIDVERRLAGQFRARGLYAVVGTPAEADVVFVAESTYIAMSAGTADPPPPRPRRADEGGRDSPARVFSDTEDEWNRRYNWRESMRNPPAPPAPAPPPLPLPLFLGIIGGDRHTNWRQSILAVAVPAEAYRQHAGDGAALSASCTWSGVAAAGWGPRSRDARAMNAASPEELVDRFHAKESGLPDYLPACAATAGTIRSIHEADEAVPSSAAQPAPDPSRPPSVERESRRPRFTSGITLVTVPLTVTGPDGQTVRGLPLSAFRVFEDDVEQTPVRLDQGTAPADLALLVDTSASMRAVRERLRTLAPALTSALRGASRAMVVTFDNRVRVTTEFTSDPSGIQRALAQAAPGGGTRLYDALALVAVDRLPLARERNAIVLLSDGRDTRSQLTDEAGALAAIETSNTPVFVVRYETSDAGAFAPPGALGIRRWLVPPEGPEQEGEARADADRFLTRLSTGTGGRLLAARPDADLPEMLAHIGNELADQAVLAYYPSNATLDGRYRRIRVTVDCEGCTVRARAGYRAGVMQ